MSVSKMYFNMKTNKSIIKNTPSCQLAQSDKLTLAHVPSVWVGRIL